MATTNWSKVDRLPLELRAGVAMRLMDRVGYEGIREWLREKQVAEDALPSDRAFRTYADNGEYALLQERRLEQIPELQEKSSVPGYPASATTPVPEPDLLSILMKHGTARLRISERLSGEFDAVSERAERAEARILADLERAWEDGIDIVPPSSIETSQAADGEANKKPYPDYLGSYADATLFRAALCLPDADPSALMLASLHMQRRDRLAKDRRMLRPNVMLRLISMLITMMGHLRRALPGVERAAGDAAKASAHATGPERSKAGAKLPFGWLTPKASAATAATAAGPAEEEEPCAQCEAERQAAALAAAAARDAARNAVGTGSEDAKLGGVALGIRQGTTDSVGLCADSVGFGRDSVSAGPAAPAAVASGGVGPVGSGLEKVVPGSLKHQMLLTVTEGYMGLVANAPPGVGEEALTRILMEYGVSLADATAAAQRIASGELDRDAVLALMVRLTSPGAEAARGRTAEGGAVSAMRA